MWRGFTSGGQEAGSVFSAAVCYRLGKHYPESLPLVPKDKSCFSQGERPAVQLSLDRELRMLDILKPSIPVQRSLKQ